jgi:hypothetical protein
MDTDDKIVLARRQFLASCGKYAALTPPTVVLLLSATGNNYAVAASGSGGTNGSGFTGGFCSPTASRFGAC